MTRNPDRSGSVANDRATLMREVNMHEATPQDTFDHMLGSGALSYSWWQDVQCTQLDADVVDDWQATLVCEDGNDGTKSVTISHESVMNTARDVVRNYLNVDLRSARKDPDTVVRECAMLLFDADNVDFDANSADCLLQLMVLGQIVFG